jgi:hypothetical protein
MFPVYVQVSGSVCDRVVLQARSSRSQHPESVDSQRSAKERLQQTEDSDYDSQRPAPWSTRQEAITDEQREACHHHSVNGNDGQQRGHPRLPKNTVGVVERPIVASESTASEGMQEKHAH